MDSIASNLASTAQDVTASFTYNPASQVDSVTKNIDAYAYTPVAAWDVVSAANGSFATRFIYDGTDPIAEYSNGGAAQFINLV